jgi:hypothetical protein
MRGVLASLLAVLALAIAAAPAQADFGFLPGAEGFDAAVTNSDGSLDLLGGRHPWAMDLHVGLSQSGGFSDGDLRDLHLALPPGLLINPTALPECSAALFHTPRTSPYETSLSGESCPAATQVGTVAVHPGGGPTRTFGLFNLAPPPGAPGAIGFAPFGLPIVLTPHIREADAGLTLDLAGLTQAFDLEGLDLQIWGTPYDVGHDGQRVNCLNEADPSAHHGELSTPPGPNEKPPFHPGTCTVFPSEKGLEEFTKSFLTLPTTCDGPLRWAVSARSWQGESAEASAESHDSEGHPAPLEDCNQALFIAKVQLTTEAAAARSGLIFDLANNDGGGILNPGGIARPAIRNATVALPEGLTINPSLGSGLGVCTEADFARESVDSAPGAGCPNRSKIGEVEVQGMLGLPEPVKGSLFVAEPYRNPFNTLLALYVVLRSPERGIFLRSRGKIEADPRSGRLLATFEDLPRLLYTHFSLSLREGQRSTMVSPPACGSYPMGIDLASWAHPEVLLHDSSSFRITRGEGGGPCPSGGAPPFHPGLEAGSINPQGGAYTPFYLHMTRTDSEQEITSYSATFPPGLLGKVSGVPYCPEAAIAAAKSQSGTESAAHPSCPAASEIGHTLAGYGVGGVLAYAPGKLYLAGPYHGSSLSVVAIDSALVGPFDLGTVVVRSAIRIDRHTAQASIDSAGSDPIPHILAGIPLHVRDIRVYVDRPGFTLNPTSCDPLATVSRLTGAGADPFSAADDSAATSSDRYQALNCSALGFRPKLAIRLKGGTKRARYPSLRATYTPRPGDANLGDAAVALPHSIFLAQEHLRSICTRAQFAADRCPADSIYGHVRAITPLLAEPLEGPVYVRSSSNPVPDLVIALRGRDVAVDVVGRIDSSRGGLRATFEGLPDAPLTKFTMTLPGGRRGLLVNAEDLCGGAQRANARFVAQSNKTEALHPRLGVKCRKHERRRHRRTTATSSEAVQRGDLRLSFDAEVRPKALPRRGVAPIAIDVGGRVATTDGSQPPQLRRVQIAINRNGRLDSKGLPTCRLEEIQPATTENALAACGDAKVGAGSFSANVDIPEQSPFPSKGKVIAFNGREGGRPVIFAHVYGTDPIPTSFTLPLRISHAAGKFGTRLSASLPAVTSKVAFVTGISLHLHRTFRYRGRLHSYLSAGCPAPAGFSGVLYPLARASYDFAGGERLSASVVRSCRVR